MGSHSNSDLNKHIQDNSQLLAKMTSLTNQLQTDLLLNFQTTAGVPFPSVVEAHVRQLQYDMVYSTDPITDEYMSGAKTLLDAAFGGDEVDIANKALDVVQVLLNNIVGSGSIQTGGTNQSEMLTHKDKAGKETEYVCCAFAQTEECNAQDWLTQTNFYVSYYAYVVFIPSEIQLATIKQKMPELVAQ